ncbi:hypothetical protein ABMA70_01655 [Halobacteriovorax sp. XZX-3]|uniref:hypothetical protein n=1 Tax=unclassified Halobacteriovorax TaxID=2639665 RepID=UPI0037184E25
MSQKKVLVILILIFVTTIIAAIGFGKYKEYVDSQLLDKSLFDGYAQRPIADLNKGISTLQISAEAKKTMTDSLHKVVAAIENLYTSDDKQSNIMSVKILRCFYRELMYTQKEFQLDIYKLMPLKKSWDEIQYPKNTSKTFLQKKIGKIGVAAKINNQFCFEQGLASKQRAEPSRNTDSFKGLFHKLNILKKVL